MRSIRKVLIGALLTSAMGAAWSARADAPARYCELGYTNSVFAPQAWPARDLGVYAQAQLGILNPNYDHFYLFIAYRRLAGLPFTSNDLAKIAPFDPCWNDGGRGYMGYEWRQSHAMVDAVADWRKARSEVVAGPDPMDRQAGTARDMYRSAPICNPDAYRHAARTLRARQAAHPNDPHVTRWIEGQDLVLQQCSTTSDRFPPPAPSDAPDWFKFDRAYQMAAAHFYAEHFPEATRQFDAIADSASSPWREWAPYLAARSLVREASFKDGDGQVSGQKQLQALDRLKQADALAVSEERRHDIARLRQRIRLQIDGPALQSELDQRLGAPELSWSIGQDVRDFKPLEQPAPRAAAERSFGTWLLAMRQGVGQVFPRTEDIPNSELWLIATLQSAKPGQAGLDVLLRKAQAVPVGSPAYLSAQYHVVRLTGDDALAMKITQKLLTKGDLSRQDQNLLKAAALPHARQARTFAAMAYKVPIESRAAQFQGVIARADLDIPVVDREAAEVLNTAIPLEALYALYADPSTPRPLRDALQSVVWVRALLLQRWRILHALNHDVRIRIPQAAPLLSQMDLARDPAEKQALGALFLVRHPGWVPAVSSSINYGPGDKSLSELALANVHRFHLEDGERENWWCNVLDISRWEQKPPATTPPAWVDKKLSRSWPAEYQVLVNTPDATEYLGKIVVAWAERHPRDERLPDALRMLVRTARGGCVSEQGVLLGRRAFKHLHRYFPKSEAARLTHSHR